jgi:hypothetical protein
MPADQCGEGNLITTVGEGVQQLLVSFFLAVLGGEQTAKTANAG